MELSQCFAHHSGHRRAAKRFGQHGVDFLSSRLGDHLIIGLNSDDSVQVLKGPTRPLVPQQDRLDVLTSLEFVDRVTLFDEQTPIELLRFLVPHILVKGADYRGKEVVGRDVVEAAGGRVELVELLPGRSTSALIRKIIEACPKQTDS